MKRFISIIPILLFPIFVHGQNKIQDGTTGEYQFVEGGTQILYIQQKEPDTVIVKEKKAKEEKVKVKKVLPKPFIGTSLGIGIDYGEYSVTTCSGHLGVDMAFYCTEKFAFGGYLKYHTIAQLSGGFLFVHHFNKPNTTFLWGVGVHGTCGSSNVVSREHPILPYARYELREWNCGAEIRLGCQFNKNWYMWFDMSHKEQETELYVIETENSRVFPYGNASYGDMGNFGYSLSLSISVGYKFNLNDKKIK